MSWFFFVAGKKREESLANNPWGAVILLDDWVSKLTSHSNFSKHTFPWLGKPFTWDSLSSDRFSIQCSSKFSQDFRTKTSIGSKSTLSSFNYIIYSNIFQFIFYFSFHLTSHLLLTMEKYNESVFKTWKNYFSAIKYFISSFFFFFHCISLFVPTTCQVEWPLLCTCVRLCVRTTELMDEGEKKKIKILSAN